MKKGIKDVHIIVIKIVDDQVVEDIDRSYKEDLTVCDICGEDAMGRTPCQVCNKDLCATHQIQVGHLGVFSYKMEPSVLEVKSGIYCKECLIRKIQTL